LVVIASVSGAVVSHMLVGDMTFLHTPPFAMVHNWELLLCAGLGLLTAGGATIFSKLMLAMEKMFEQMDPVGEIWLPAVGGFGIGLLGVFVPPILGEGFEFMTQLVRGEPIYVSFVIGAFLLLTIAKMIGTGLSLGSGGSGGLLMPCFFCGGTLGAVFGIAAGRIFPSINNYGPYALLGTAAFFAAVSRAPFTAIILLFELTHDSHVILPGMVACVAAVLAARNIAPLSYEAMRLSRKGLSPIELESKDTLVHLHVDATMVRNVVTLKETMTFAELRQVIAETRHTGYPVVDDRGLLVGLVADGDLYSAVARGGDPNDLHVRDIMRRVYGTVTPDMTLRKAVEVMNEYGQDRVPVVDEMNPQHIVGLVSRSQIVAAFRNLSH
ncbi:MAG: chloride channel protein, partial [Elusimicrobia bacterium]|nr:chloride channel protein [Elusimicrobiota bacterium]